MVEAKVWRIRFISIFFAVLFLLSLASCGAKLSGGVGGDCYECINADLPCTCPQSYGGYENPEALDIYRPGRFDDLNYPAW